MVHQHFTLVEALTVADNLEIGGYHPSVRQYRDETYERVPGRRPVTPRVLLLCPPLAGNRIDQRSDN